MGIHWTFGGGRTSGAWPNCIRMVGRVIEDDAVVVADCTEQPQGWSVALRVNDEEQGELQTQQRFLGDALQTAVGHLLAAA